jgi:hypothetical protein
MKHKDIAMRWLTKWFRPAGALTWRRDCPGMVIRDNVIRHNVLARPWMATRRLILLACVVAMPAGSAAAADAPLAGPTGTPVQIVGPGLAQQTATAASTAALAAAQAPIAPVVPTSLVSSLVVKPSPGTLYSAYATALTGGTGGYLLALNATTVQADGAVVTGTLLANAPFVGGIAQLNYQGIPAAAFSLGIVLVVSSAATPFTITTGPTAWISGTAR